MQSVLLPAGSLLEYFYLFHSLRDTIANESIEPGVAAMNQLLNDSRLLGYKAINTEVIAIFFSAFGDDVKSLAGNALSLLLLLRGQVKSQSRKPFFLPFLLILSFLLAVVVVVWMPLNWKRCIH
jgi:hypothetical protein